MFMQSLLEVTIEQRQLFEKAAVGRETLLVLQESIYRNVKQKGDSRLA
jgi:hypothetical protein